MRARRVAFSPASGLAPSSVLTPRPALQLGVHTAAGPSHERGTHKPAASAAGRLIAQGTREAAAPCLPRRPWGRHRASGGGFRRVPVPQRPPGAHCFCLVSAPPGVQASPPLPAPPRLQRCRCAWGLRAAALRQQCLQAPLPPPSPACCWPPRAVVLQQLRRVPAPPAVLKLPLGLGSWTTPVGAAAGAAAQRRAARPQRGPLRGAASWHARPGALRLPLVAAALQRALPASGLRVAVDCWRLARSAG